MTTKPRDELWEVLDGNDRVVRENLPRAEAMRLAERLITQYRNTNNHSAQPMADQPDPEED